MLLRYVGQRLVLTVPVFLSVVSVIFLVVRVLPGDPAQAALGENASRQAVDALRTSLASTNANVVVAHALRSALLPIVSLTGVWAVALVGDSVTTELVFSRPGLGKMMVGAMLQRDYTSLQSVMVVYTFFVVGINLITDLAYGVVDPRIRRGAA
jgi:ABC-type dipeptide/oligopeptide/nickel transport system permease component